MVLNKRSLNAKGDFQRQFEQVDTRKTSGFRHTVQKILCMYICYTIRDVKIGLSSKEYVECFFFAKLKERRKDEPTIFIQHSRNVSFHIIHTYNYSKFSGFVTIKGLMMKYEVNVKFQIGNPLYDE